MFQVKPKERSDGYQRETENIERTFWEMVRTFRRCKLESVSSSGSSSVKTEIEIVVKRLRRETLWKERMIHSSCEHGQVVGGWGYPVVHVFSDSHWGRLRRGHCPGCPCHWRRGLILLICLRGICGSRTRKGDTRSRPYYLPPPCLSHILPIREHYRSSPVVRVEIRLRRRGTRQTTGLVLCHCFFYFEKGLSFLLSRMRFVGQGTLPSKIHSWIRCPTGP